MATPTVILQSNDPCWCGSGRKYKRCHKPLEGRVLPGELSPTRSVPPEIQRPPYADTGEVRRWDEPHVKSPATIERMRESGRLAAEVLRLRETVQMPGRDDLDLVAGLDEPPAEIGRVRLHPSDPMGIARNGDDADPHGGPGISTRLALCEPCAPAPARA